MFFFSNLVKGFFQKSIEQWPTQTSFSKKFNSIVKHVYLQINCMGYFHVFGCYGDNLI